MTIITQQKSISSQDCQQYQRTIHDTSQSNKNSKVGKMIDFFEHDAFKESRFIPSNYHPYSTEDCKITTRQAQ